FSVKLPLEEFPFTVTALFLYWTVFRFHITQQRVRLPRSSILPLALALLVIGFVTSVYGMDPAGSLRKLYNVANAVVVLWATVQIVGTPSQIRQITRALFTSAGVYSLMGIAQVAIATWLGPGLSGATIVAGWNRALLVWFE